MEILVANKMDWNHPKAGGVEINLRETLSRLAERGHEVHLLTSRYPEGSGYEEIEGVKIHRCGVRGRKNELFILTFGQFYLNYLARKLEPDIIYSVNSIVGWFPVSDIPHLTAVHHIYGDSIFEQFNFPFNLLCYIAESLTLYLTTERKMVSVSPSTTRRLMERGFQKEDITEIINGVDTESYRPGKEADKPLILYLGRMEYNKGVDMIPGIYNRLSQELGDFSLEIAGFGSKQQILENLAEENNNVVFHGYVDENSKKSLLQRAWVLIVPSRFEGWGMVVSEANASGTPAIGFDTDGLRDSIDDGVSGYLVDLNGDAVDKFSLKVVELVRDDKERVRMADQARQLAESREWGATVDRLENILEEVAER